jgi:hypothetical protein
MSTGRLGAGDTAIQPTLLDAKGDLIAATAADTPARLAVGANGESLVADSSTATGLRWQGSFEAGKNKIINGDFRINQRAFSSTTTTGTYGFDRWLMIGNDGTTTYSAQTFTAGTAPVAGYEGINFARLVSSGQTGVNAYSILQQKIEDVRTFAGQRITISFWAKASSGTPKVSVNVYQDFGSGGSAGAYSYPDTAALQNVTINTSWTRYSFSILVAGISGKTIGTGSNLTVYLWTSAGTTYNAQTNSMGIQSATIDFWGVQVEAGSVATPFQTATGTLQGELSACMRYFEKIDMNNDGNTYAAANGTNSQGGFVFYKSQKRGSTTVTLNSGSIDWWNGSVWTTVAPALSGTTDFFRWSIDTGTSTTNRLIRMSSAIFYASAEL